MATLDRRVQILLDPGQYELLEREALARNRSVASIIRESLDQRFGVDLSKRRAALARLMASADSPDAATMKDWDEIKNELEEDRYGEEPAE